MIFILLMRLNRAIEYHNDSAPKDGYVSINNDVKSLEFVYAQIKHLTFYFQGQYYIQIQRIYGCNYSGPIDEEVLNSTFVVRKVFSENREEFTRHWTAFQDYSIVYVK